MKHIRKFNEANIERETLEEAAERATRNESLGWENEYAKEKFIEGAKWQMERSYSDEEVNNLISDILYEVRYDYSNIDIIENNIINIFEQFKKK